MDRVFYEDGTLKASCPACGSDDWLYRKNNAISKKGHFVTFKEDGWSWGRNELKHFGVARIDCTYEQAKQWCETIEDEQAQTDSRYYGDLAGKRRAVVISVVRADMPSAAKDELKQGIKEALKSDQEYQSLVENERQAENRAMIEHRSRKRAFDFEKVLTTGHIENWNDMDKYSEIIVVSEQDKSQIKEIQWL